MRMKQFLCYNPEYMLKQQTLVELFKHNLEEKEEFQSNLYPFYVVLKQFLKTDTPFFRLFILINIHIPASLKYHYNIYR